MIPKIIHYCWFGKGKMPDLYINCMDSWKKVLPDYEIKCWNEDTFDINQNDYIREAYMCKKYAFVTDYVRLFVLYKYGGIYMDTDVEVLKKLDCFLFECGFSGFEKKDSVPTGIMGAEKGNPVIFDLLSYYDNRRFCDDNGNMNLTTNVVAISRYFVKKGLKLNGKKQTIDGFCLYPQKYFCTNSILVVLKLKPNYAYTIHHYGGGWGRDGKKNQTLKFRFRRYLVGEVRNLIGTEKTKKISEFSNTCRSRLKSK